MLTLSLVGGLDAWMLGPTFGGLLVVLTLLVLLVLVLLQARWSDREHVALREWIAALPAQAPAPRSSDPVLLEAKRKALGLVQATSSVAAAPTRSGGVRARFMAAMGHELRSPLNSIVGFSQVLEEGNDGPLNEAQLENVVLVRRAAEDLLRLLTDILDSARIEARRLKLRQMWTASVEILTDTTRAGKAVLEGTAVQIDTELQPGLPPVFVDRARVVQAATNLFRRAVYGRASGVVLLRARVGQGQFGRALRIEVTDPDRTIDAAAAAAMFEERIERKKGGQRPLGLSLALSVARELARAHGGDAWCEPDSKAGTVWVLAIPIVAG